MEEESAKPAKAQKKRRGMTKLQVGVLAFLLGTLSFIALRFLTITYTSVHHHANFAVYVNGTKDEFDSFTFYEEVQACSLDDANNVKSKVHMHDRNGGLVHVHAAGMTWGQFFANLGYGLSNKALTTDDGVFVDDQNGNQLTFILNGQPVGGVANQVINSEDVLLINYGKEDNETIQTRADAIPRDAQKANLEKDPGVCGGAHELTPTERLKNAIGIGQKVEAH